MHGRIMSKRAMDRDMPYDNSEMIAIEKRTLIYSPTEIERTNEDNKRYTLEENLRTIGQSLARNYPFDDYRIYIKDIEMLGRPIDIDATLEALVEAGWAVGIVQNANPPYFQFSGSL